METRVQRVEQKHGHQEQRFRSLSREEVESHVGSSSSSSSFSTSSASPASRDRARSQPKAEAQGKGGRMQNPPPPRSEGVAAPSHTVADNVQLPMAVVGGFGVLTKRAISREGLCARASCRVSVTSSHQLVASAYPGVQPRHHAVL